MTQQGTEGKTMTTPQKPDISAAADGATVLREALEEARTELRRHTASICQIDLSTRLNFPADSLAVKEASALWEHHTSALAKIAAALSSPATSPWQPIATAPKDGTDFLASIPWQGEHHQRVGCFA